MGTITKLYTLDATEAHALRNLIRIAHAVLGPLDRTGLLPANRRLLYRGGNSPAVPVPLEEYCAALLSLRAEFAALPPCHVTTRALATISSLLPHEG